MEKQKLLNAFSCLHSAMMEANGFGRQPRKTDLVGVARQYAGRRISRKDFQKVMKLTLEEIVSISGIPTGEYKPLGPRKKR